MADETRVVSSTAGPPQAATAPACERYEPPAVAWEEEFAPLAASDPLCPDPFNPDCPPG